MSFAEHDASTRVFVSGLPPALTSKQLRDHFSQRFDVTDAHVIPDRRIGFVGLTDHESARKALCYFNKSFVRMSKISVELARPVELRKDGKGQATPVSHRTQRTESRSNEAQRNTQKRKRGIQDDGENLRGLGNPEAGQTILPLQSDRTMLPATSSAENVESQEEASGSPAHHLAIEIGPPAATGDDLPNSPKEEVATANDSDWLRGKTSRTLDLMDIAGSLGEQEQPQIVREAQGPRTSEAQNTEEELKKVEETQSELREEAEEAAEVPNARLFVRNLPYSAAEDELTTLFTPFGKIEEIHLVRDKKTSTSKGLAFVQFFDPDNARSALHDLDGQPFQGRLLHILPASEKKDKKLTDFEISKLPLKQQKALKRKTDTPVASFSWNSLYMNPDAVVASVASRLGVPKSDILDPSSADAAVRQAQAETSVIQETKDYLRTVGINTEAFKSRQRDDRAILLKNFPFGTTLEDLSSLLSEYGKVERLVFPPTGTMAIARFEEAHACHSAIKGLAYINLKGSVLYVEKAPDGMFRTTASNPQAERNQLAVDDNESTGGQVANGISSTVFVRNLNFATTSTRLTEVFKPLSGFLCARVKTRTDATRPAQILSMGFGFVEFRTKQQAEAAVATMNGHRLDGHEILAQHSQKSLDAGEERRKEDISKKSDQQKTKLVIKNLPFEASKKDVKTLFGAYGALRSVRMPKKFDQSARGFAFADFTNAKEARNAMEALSNTHLLGRRLAIDFAEGDAVDPEEALKAMEKKAGHQVHLNTVNKILAGSSRKKFNVDARDDGD